jgi:hypothetical protein
MRLRLFVVLCRSNAGERQRPAVGDGGRIINTVDMRPWGRETIPKMKQGESTGRRSGRVVFLGAACEQMACMCFWSNVEISEASP